MVLMKKVQFSDWLITGYMIISAAAFTSYFGLGIWQIRRLARSSIESKVTIDVGAPQTSELNPADVRGSLEPATSVTEHTTRTLEPVAKEPITR